MPIFCGLKVGTLGFNTKRDTCVIHCISIYIRKTIHLYLFSALELEGRSLEDGQGVVLRGGDDAEWSRRLEVHRVDGLGLAADLTDRRAGLGHKHVTETVNNSLTI